MNVAQHKIINLLKTLWDLKKKILFILFRDRGREGEREGEKHQHVVASHVPQTGVLACNPGICPDWELNWWSFGLQACAHPLSYTSHGHYEIFLGLHVTMYLMCSWRQLFFQYGPEMPKGWIPLVYRITLQPSHTDLGYRITFYSWTFAQCLFILPFPLSQLIYMVSEICMRGLNIGFRKKYKYKNTFMIFPVCPGYVTVFNLKFFVRMNSVAVCLF